MSCHLQEIVAEARNGELRHHIDVDRDTQIYALRFLDELAPSAVCFDAGEVTSWNEITPKKELIRLPFPVCYIEAKVCPPDEPWRSPARILLLAKQLPTSIVFVVFRWIDIEPWNMLVGMFKYIESGGSDIEQDEAPAGILSKFPWRWVYKFLSALNCCNVVRVEHTPDPKLQRARIRRGKQPLFSYWTLQLQAPTRHNTAHHQGGTHASPRVHLVRGHICRSRRVEGRWWWRQAHVRGNREEGMVHKDYAVSAGESGGQPA